MKNIHAAILAACLATVGTLTAQAQTNTAYGSGALPSVTTGTGNSAFGFDTLNVNTTGYNNTAMGTQALVSNVSGAGNVAGGFQSLFNNTDGGYNIAFGTASLYSNTSGEYNIAIGFETGDGISTGSNNIAIGSDAGNGLTTGDFNIAIGASGGQGLTTGSYNIDIGNFGNSTDSGAIRIGRSDEQTSFYAAGINGVTISDGIEVFINSSGQLGTVNSSIRFKKDVRDMAGVSDRLFQLRPVTYRYKRAYADGSNPVEYGLIAEEVAQVYPDMVARDATGQIQTVQYQKLTPLLLNEVQKEHRQLEAQQQTIEMLTQRLSKLEAARSNANTTLAMVSK